MTMGLIVAFAIWGAAPTDADRGPESVAKWVAHLEGLARDTGMNRQPHRPADATPRKPSGEDMARLRAWSAASSDAGVRISACLDDGRTLGPESRACAALEAEAWPAAERVLQLTRAPVWSLPESLRYYSPSDQQTADLLALQYVAKVAVLHIASLLRHARVGEAAEVCLDTLALGRDLQFGTGTAGFSMGSSVGGIIRKSCSLTFDRLPAKQRATRVATLERLLASTPGLDYLLILQFVDMSFPAAAYLEPSLLEKMPPEVARFAASFTQPDGGRPLSDEGSRRSVELMMMAEAAELSAIRSVSLDGGVGKINGPFKLAVRGAELREGMVALWHQVKNAK